MKTDLIQSLTQTFEGHAQRAENGVEFWLARDLQHLLDYSKWDNFLNVVSRAKTACEISGHTIADHFADVSKMVDLGSGSMPFFEPPAFAKNRRLMWRRHTWMAARIRGTAGCSFSLPPPA